MFPFFIFREISRNAFVTLCNFFYRHERQGDCFFQREQVGIFWNITCFLTLYKFNLSVMIKYVCVNDLPLRTRSI